MTIYSAHQPDLLPYSGFWYKMAKADLFDLKIWDQFVDTGYQHRVKMRDQWVHLPMVESSSTDPIFAKRIVDGAPGHLADEIVKRYLHSRTKPPYWDKYGPMICDEITSSRTDMLWEVNLRLILLVRQILGIETPLTFSRPALPGKPGSAGIISVIQAFKPPMEYLSGTGGRSSVGDCQEFTDAGIPVIWSRHQAGTGDSVLSILFDHEDPLAVVLAEHDEPDPGAHELTAYGSGQAHSDPAPPSVISTEGQ